MWLPIVQGYPIKLTCAGATLFTKIFALPTSFFKNKTIELDQIEYLPFSIYHGYNEFISKWSSSIKQVFGLEVASLPFSTNDVSYDPSGSMTDKIGGERYLNFKGVINWTAW